MFNFILFVGLPIFINWNIMNNKAISGDQPN